MTVTEVGDLEMVSQPAVSRALARLEKQVGTPLLHRTGRTLRMTQAGSAFKRHVDALLHELDDGLAAVAQLADPGSGTVALAFQHSLGTWLVPDLIRSMHVDRPGVQFALTQVTDDPAGTPAAAEADLVLGSRAPGPGLPVPPAGLRAAAAGDGDRAPAAPAAARLAPRRGRRAVRRAAGDLGAARADRRAVRAGRVHARTSCSRATTCPPCAASSQPGWG